jgi:LCP family protein required for cell wall assembly
MDRSQEYNSKPKTPIKSKWLLVGLSAAFILAAIFTIWLTYSVVREMFSSSSTVLAPELILEDPQSAVDAVLEGELGVQGETPLQSSGGPAPVPWDGNSRINVLVMGLDNRDRDNPYDVPRTDTLILFSLDPESRTAGMLSIPRDLWVDIPGFDHNKVNQAYRLGEIYDVPGLGPGQAMRTVEELLGMEIDYYAQVDLLAFEGFIDELGGISVEVTEEIVVDPLGANNTQVLSPGEQVLPGWVALAYARARNTIGSDFDRAERQQQVVMAIRDRILSAELLPGLIKNSPAIYQNLSSGISTNLTLTQLVRLAWIAHQIEDTNIRRGIIGVDQVEFGFSYDGQDILRPLANEILQLRDEIFTISGPVVPLATEAVSQELVSEEYASVLVLNGTLSPGLASQTADYLRNSGIEVNEPANAETLYSNTILIDYTGNPHTIEMIVTLMSIAPENVYHRFDTQGPADIVVITGDDWANDNPMQ